MSTIPQRRATGPTEDLDPRQVVLLEYIDGANSPGVDPIRIMKGLFIVAQEAPQGWLPQESRYSFEPYNYGPYSSAIYRHLDSLEAAGLLTSTQAPGTRWKSYVVSQKGASLAERNRNRMNDALVSYIVEVREWLTGLTFEQLLNAVYDRYPDYASKSLFRSRQAATQ